MNVLSVLFPCIAVLLVGCGDSKNAYHAPCEEELKRKGNASNMEFRSVKFAEVQSSADGDLLTGEAIFQIGDKETPVNVSCVMQGEGASASVVRSEFSY